MTVATYQVIKPQDGPQTLMMMSQADVGVYGGSAGSGKTWELLVDPLRHMKNGEFGAQFFRRTFPQITNQGAMWDASMKIYPAVGATPKQSTLRWIMPSGAVFSFHHLQHDADVSDWQGSELPSINLDELTHFTEHQFFYLMSRNRSMCGVKPYMRSTTNPDANSWVKQFILPWIDTTVDPRERPKSGELLYFIRENGAIKWVDKHYRYREAGVEVPAKSLTFVRASIFDNKKLLEVNPEYLANLRSLPLVEQERLLYGNWDIVESGNMFRHEWFLEVNSLQVPVRFKRIVRFWDLASSKPSEVEKHKADPDWTCGALVGVTQEGVYYLIDMVLERDTPGNIENLMRKTAEEDRFKYGAAVEVAYEEEPGGSGVFVTHHLKSRVLRGYRFTGFKSTGSKINRAKPLSGELQKGGTFYVQRAAWNSQAYALMTAFPAANVHDDPVDACSGAYNYLNAPIEEDIYIPSYSAVSGWGQEGMNRSTRDFEYETAMKEYTNYAELKNYMDGIGPDTGTLTVENGQIVHGRSVIRRVQVGNGGTVARDKVIG